MNSSYYNHFANLPWLLIVRLFVAAALLIFLVSYVGFDTIIDVMISIKPINAIAIGLGLMLFLSLGAFNVWILLGVVHKINYNVFVRVYFYSWAVGLITPGQLGDASIVLLLKKYQIPFRRTGLIYIIDKAITLFVFFIIALYGCHMIGSSLQIAWYRIIVMSLIIGLIAIMIIAVLLKLGNFNITNKLINVGELLSEIKRFRSNWHVIVVNMTITITKWLLISFVFYFSFYSLHTSIKWPEIAVIPIMSTLVGYIPVSIAGIGTVEITATYLFSTIDVPENIVVSVYLLIRGLQYLLASITVLLFGGLKNQNLLSNYS